jgi:hypothetical protein
MILFLRQQHEARLDADEKSKNFSTPNAAEKHKSGYLSTLDAKGDIQVQIPLDS